MRVSTSISATFWGPLFETVVGITFIWDAGADLLEGISAAGAFLETEGASLVPAWACLPWEPSILLPDRPSPWVP